MRKLYRKVIAAINSIKIFFWSLSFLPYKTWLRFWFTFPEEMHININSIPIIVRTRTLPAKIVDLYMATSCIRARQYTPRDFEINKSDTVIDIGAHIGSFSILAAHLAPDGRIFSFEPDLANYAQLTKNINARNAKNVAARQYAISATRGTIAFQSDSLNTAESSIYKKGTRTINVVSTTLEDIFKQENIEMCNYLKLDCEGAEYEILFSTPKELFSKIDKIVMECHNPRFFNIANPAYSYDKMIAFLKNLGYKIRVVHENAMHNLIFAKR